MRVCGVRPPPPSTLPSTVQMLTRCTTTSSYIIPTSAASYCNNWRPCASRNWPTTPRRPLPNASALGPTHHLQSRQSSRFASNRATTYPVLQQVVSAANCATVAASQTRRMCFVVSVMCTCVCVLAETVFSNGTQLLIYKRYLIIFVAVNVSLCSRQHCKYVCESL